MILSKENIAQIMGCENHSCKECCVYFDDQCVAMESLVETIEHAWAELDKYKVEVEKLPKTCVQNTLYDECNGGYEGCLSICPKYKEEAE